MGERIYPTHKRTGQEREVYLRAEKGRERMELSGIHLWGAGKRRNANKEVERREETGEKREGNI